MRKTIFLLLWLLAFPALSLAIDCDGDSNDDHDVACGGTNASTLTDGGVLLGSGTDAVTAMAVLADGEMIVGDGTTDPVAESGATLRTSIGVGTGDSPQFTGIELSHVEDNTLTASGGVLSIEGGALAPVASPTFTGTVTLPSNQALLGSPTVATSIDPAVANTASLGSGSKEWSDAYFGDGAIIYFGEGDDVTLTHSHNVGLLMELDDRLMFNAVTEGISSDDAGYLDLDAATGIRFNAAVSSSGDVTVGSGGDPADTGTALNLVNAATICWEASPAGTDICMDVNASEVMGLGITGATGIRVGPAAPDDTQPTFSIQGDADSDAGGDTTEALTWTLTPNADPTLATWGLTSTQSAGYTIDKSVDVTGSVTATKFIAGGIIQYKDGAADGDIAALNDTASVGSDEDPLVLTTAEMMGTTITNLGASGALYFLLPTAAIGMNVIFNVDVAQDIHLKFPAGNDEGYWKDYDDTGFALQATGKDIQCNATIAIGDRLFLQTRKVASTIEYFVWSDVDACIIEP